MSPLPDSVAPDPVGVIHDLGYRRYDGTRRGDAAIARALFVTGVQHAFGLRRSSRSKVLPFTLVGLVLVPAAVMVGILTFGAFGDLPVAYADYATQMQMLTSVFAAAQAPVLFSRDLRSRAIVLYAARPLPMVPFALVRWASLAAAIWAYLMAPILLLFVGALLARLDPLDHAGQAGQAALGAALLAAVLASLTGLISAYSVRRGFAIVASIAVLLIGGGIVALLQALADAQGADLWGQIAGLFAPFTLIAGVVDIIGGTVTTVVEPEGFGMRLLYLGVAVGGPALAVALIARRLSTAAAR